MTAWRVCTDTVVPLSFFMGQRKQRAPAGHPFNPTSLSDVILTLLVLLNVCFGAVPLIRFVFPNNEV